MANGKNQPLVFTREDSDRLARIEEKLDDVIDIKGQVIRNTTWIKIFKWTGVSTTGIGIITIGLKVFGVI